MFKKIITLVYFLNEYEKTKFHVYQITRNLDNSDDSFEASNQNVDV